MLRFAFFVDGSNLFGSIRSMNLDVQDYEELYAYVFEEAADTYADATHQTSRTPACLQRVSWYVVGSMDQWDLALPQSQAALEKAFKRDRQVSDAWLATTGKEHPELDPAKLREKAWVECFADFKEWYQHKQTSLEKMRSFYQAIRINTDLIDVVEAGHWKVDFLHKMVEEKGLDTALAVDMLALEDNYDVAVVISGDADMMPSFEHAKSRGKHVAAVEFVHGSPPEKRGRTFSSRLKEVADTVVRIYESELLRLELATRSDNRSEGPA